MFFLIRNDNSRVHRFMNWHHFISMFLLLVVLLPCSIILVFLPSSPSSNHRINNSNDNQTTATVEQSSPQQQEPPLQQRNHSPNPWQDLEACGDFSQHDRGQLNVSRVCDVHHVLSWVDLLSIESEAKTYQDTYQNFFEPRNCTHHGIPLAVVIVPFLVADYSPQEHATIVRESWRSVGVPSDCYSNSSSSSRGQDDNEEEEDKHGILILVSVREKRAFLFGGDDVLPETRHSQILNYMKPLLRRGEVHHAITTAIQALSDVMRQVAAEDHGDVYIKHVPPNNHKEIAYYRHHGKKGPYILLYISIALTVVVCGCYCCRHCDVKHMVQQQYERLDMLKAWALQTKYQTTFCSICLEDFQCEKQDNTTTGERRPLIQGFGRPKLVGSDGLPLKILRCGHVFDATCWDSWTESCRSTALTCPVCRRPLDDPNKTKNNNAPPPQPRLERTTRRNPQSSLNRHRLRQWPPPSYYADMESPSSSTMQAAPPPVRVLSRSDRPARLLRLQSPTSYGAAAEQGAQQEQDTNNDDDEDFSWYDELYGPEASSLTEVESMTEFAEEVV